MSNEIMFGLSAKLGQQSAKAAEAEVMREPTRKTWKEMLNELRESKTPPPKMTLLELLHNGDFSAG